MHHRVGLTRALRADAVAQPDRYVDALAAWAVGDGALPDPITVREKAIVDYALALTVRPGQMTQVDLLPMRTAGLDDAAILEVNQVVGYYAYANRVVDGLGVQLEDWHDPPPEPPKPGG